MFHTTNHIEICCKISLQQRAGYHLVERTLSSYLPKEPCIYQTRLVDNSPKFHRCNIEDGHLLLAPTWDKVPVDGSEDLEVGSIARHVGKSRTGAWEWSEVVRVCYGMWIWTSIYGVGVGPAESDLADASDRPHIRSTYGLVWRLPISPDIRAVFVAVGWMALFCQAVSRQAARAFMANMGLPV